MSRFPSRLLWHRLACGVLLGGLSLTGCTSEAASPSLPYEPILGGWLAPRDGHPLDSDSGDAALAAMRQLGVRVVAVGQRVEMPSIRRPALAWGDDDGALRGFLRRVRKAGMQSFLMPRIESPDFFVPPYPFRADIDFTSLQDWNRFHDDMEKMILHYARIAQEEGVQYFALGLELKHSVRKHPEHWRRIIRKVRGMYHGKITYSANWYDEWRDLEFWSDLDFIGVGAYFELQGEEPVGQATTEQLERRWQPIADELEAVSRSVGRPVLFTEVGYTGYFDCAERPWEWAGKSERSVAIDHQAQARATDALLRVVFERKRIAGLFLWSFYTDARSVAPWEYSVQGRPAEAVLRGAYQRAR